MQAIPLKNVVSLDLAQAFTLQWKTPLDYAQASTLQWKTLHHDMCVAAFLQWYPESAAEQPIAAADSPRSVQSHFIQLLHRLPTVSAGGYFQTVMDVLKVMV